jgi:hypothetical protein
MYLETGFQDLLSIGVLVCMQQTTQLASLVAVVADSNRKGTQDGLLVCLVWYALAVSCRARQLHFVVSVYPVV